MHHVTSLELSCICSVCSQKFLLLNRYVIQAGSFHLYVVQPSLVMLHHEILMYRYVCYTNPRSCLSWVWPKPADSSTKESSSVLWRVPLDQMLMLQDTAVKPGKPVLFGLGHQRDVDELKASFILPASM